ncbi:MAG: hypothetical protein AcusKO_35530 [Acuticoccus sp.]
MLKTRLPAALTPLATRFGLSPFYGDLHNHCALSYGHGSLKTALARAKRQLDFVSITGHAYWPDMPVDDPRVRYIVDFHEVGFARLEKAWPGHFATLRAAVDATFTVFPGYEIHSCAHGDLTILYKSLAEAPVVKADSPAALLAALGDKVPGGALAFHHHIGYRQGARGINWGSLVPALTPVIEIVSMHGLSEESHGTRPFLHSMGPSDGTSTVRHGLAEGHVFGFLGNTDHHSGYPGSYGHGRSCLYAPANTPDALWQTLWDRTTTALTGDCAHLFCAMGAHAQGSLVPADGPGEIAIEAVGGSAIDTIDLIRNGELAARISPALSPAPIGASGEDGGQFETLLVLELGWGSRGRHHDFAGTLSLAGGTILSVEPRLRGPEIVSPLEGEEASAPDDDITFADGIIDFAIRAHANPNNQTPTTQAIAARVALTAGATIVAEIDGEALRIPARRLLEGGALSGNVGPIDSAAYRFHPMPRPAAYQWHGTLPVAPLTPGETLYVRMRQDNGQWAWASPFFCN